MDFQQGKFTVSWYFVLCSGMLKCELSCVGLSLASLRPRCPIAQQSQWRGRQHGSCYYVDKAGVYVNPQRARYVINLTVIDCKHWLLQTSIARAPLLLAISNLFMGRQFDTDLCQVIYALHRTSIASQRFTLRGIACDIFAFCTICVVQNTK